MLLSLPLNRARIAARLTLVSASAPIWFTVMAIVATLQATSYSSISSPISELGSPANPTAWIINLAFVGYAVLVQGLGPALFFTARSTTSGVLLWTLVGVYGAGGMLAAVFADGGTQTFPWGVDENQAHSIVARVTFSAIFSLMVATPLLHWREPSWAGWRKFSLGLFVPTIAFAALFQLLPSDGGIHGMLQRGFFATTMLWVFVTSLHARRLLRRGDVATR